MHNHMRTRLKRVHYYNYLVTGHRAGVPVVNKPMWDDQMLPLPTTMVSSGISSIKHFRSVSPRWKYRADTLATTSKTQNKRITSNILKPEVNQQTSDHAQYMPRLGRVMRTAFVPSSSLMQLQVYVRDHSADWKFVLTAGLPDWQ